MKKQAKKLICLLLALVLSLSLFACGGSGGNNGGGNGGNSGSGDGSQSEEEPTLVLSIGHNKSEGSVLDSDVRAFCDAVTERTNGSITFNVYPNSTMGDNTVMQERLSIGDMDMMLAEVTPNLDKRFTLYVYYLARDWDEAYEVYGPESELMDYMGDVALENGFRILGVYPLYFGGLALVKEPQQPDNMEFKEDIKIRVPTTYSFTLAAEAYGYLSTPIGLSDTYTAVQTGIVDGILGAGAEGYYDNFRDLIHYYLPVSDHFENNKICISSATWDKLSENQRTILTEEAEKTCAHRWEVAPEAQEEFEQKLADLGVKVYEFDDAYYDHVSEVLVNATWDALSETWARQKILCKRKSTKSRMAR